MKLSPFVEYLVGDVLPESLHVTVRAMMGGHTLYSDGKVFAIAEDDTLWLKGSDTLVEWYLSRGAKKFSYIKEGKPQGMNYFSVPEEVLENTKELDEWIDVALSVATLPKKKK